MAEQSNRIQFLKDALKNLSSAVREVSNGLIDLEKVISRLSGKTREFAKEQQKAAQSVNRVGKNLKDTAKTVDDYGKNTEKASKSQKGLFGGIGKNLRTIVQFYGAYQVLNLAISAFRELAIGSAKRAIQLEKALKDVAAVANLTSKDMDRLETVVFKVAGTTSLTAMEVVALQKELAKLGTSVSDIEKLTGPIALLSQALGEDAGGVAATLKKTLNQFQATSTESERFSNILLGAVNETALSLNDLGTALGYVGPLGAQLGVSFEETAALLGILADNGFKASKAGTGLRSFFIAAAKDGRPFNEFLEDVADRSLDATEAVQTFGKIAASQALVLSKNVDVYKELSNSLGDLNRLLKANADQMSSTQGQIDLIGSAYDRASIRLGDYITKTEFFLEILERLDPATAGQARAFNVISGASAETSLQLDNLSASMINFGGDAEENALNTTQLLLDVLESSGSIAEETLGYWREYAKDGGDLMGTLSKMQSRGALSDDVEDTLLLAEGLLDIYAKQAKTQRDLRIEEKARNENYKEAEKLTNKLTQAAREGLLTDEEQERVTKGLTQKLTQLQKARERSGLTTEEIIVLEKRIDLFQELQTTVKNLENSEAAIEKNKQARIEKAFKSDLELIQNELKARLDSIKAITDTELAGAQSAEEAAEIRLKQEKLLQAAYQESVRSINELKDAYPNFISEIEAASKSYEKFVEFTQSDIGKEGVTILKDYKNSFEALGKQLKDEKISLGEYEAQNDALEASLITSITTLKNSTDANEELKDMLDKIVVSYLNAKKGAEDYIEATKENFKTISLLGKTIVKDLTIEEAIGMSLATTTDAISNFNDVALENTKARLESEKDLIENRYQVEQDILKSQLDNQLITESQYRQKQKELRKAKLAEENAIDKELFQAEKKRDRQDARTGYLQALASIIPNLIVYDKEANPIGLSIKAALSGALATAAYGAELAAIGQRKFVPKKFKQGGMVSGPSHSQGGVPFSVQGQGGYEMEGGEFIVNKRATAKHYDLLQRINDSYRTAPRVGSLKFADGGLINSPMNESVDYLKAIAEATTSTAIGVSKPVRAYVSDKDLRTNATERRIRDRNDRL